MKNISIRFADVAQQLYDNGYAVTPLSGKRPVIDDWAALDVDGKTVKRWIHDYARNNLGIRTAHTPAIDIDVYDADAAEEMETWCLEHLSDAAPVRIGQLPKRLLVFRSDTPFRKMKETWVDAAGTKHAIEILGKGQQFAAFGVHPDTRKPFSWVSIESPLDIAADDLPELTQADAARVLEAFAQMAARRGWTRKGSKALTTQADSDDSDDDALLGMASKASDLDDADIRDALSLIDIDEADYDRWLTVGMALHHQYDGGETGLELWDEWSTESEDYDYDELKEKWASFSVVRSGGTPTTVATLLKWAKEGKKVKTRDEFDRALNLIRTCADADELFDDVARKVAKIAVEPHQLQEAALAMQSRMFELKSTKMPINDVRKCIVKKGRSRKDTDEQPEWVRDFVWMESDDRFYCLSERKAMTSRSYNGRYDKHMLTAEDKAMKVGVPSTRAADAARTLYGMQHVDGMIYLPGAEQLVRLDETEVRVNSYDDRSVPEIEEPTTKAQKRALRAVQAHFEMLFRNERERNIALSFLAYHVQCPAERVNWALLIQGVEGAGKTWMQNLMASVLGPRNVKPVKPSSLFSDFNAWAEGTKMNFVEEIRMRGHDRFEVLDKVKDVITNDTIEVTRKGRDPISLPNVTSYVLFTNWQDALSLSDNDRRYMILRTSLQNKHQVDTMLRASPDYFTDLFNAVAEHPGVMRWWLMSLPLAEDFCPKGKAPMTGAKGLMRDLNRSDEQDAIEDLLRAAVFPDCTNYLLNVTALPGRLTDLEGDFVVPRTSALKAMLEQMGFTFLGRFKIEGTPQRYYTRRPDLFEDEDETVVAGKVRLVVEGYEPEFV